MSLLLTNTAVISQLYNREVKYVHPSPVAKVITAKGNQELLARVQLSFWGTHIKNVKIVKKHQTQYTKKNYTNMWYPQLPQMPKSYRQEDCTHQIKTGQGKWQER